MADKIPTTSEPERRSLVSMELREEKDGKRQIVGVAAVFDQYTQIYPWLMERIAQGAFDGVLGDDVRGLLNHDRNIVLGRTKSKTLRLSIDSNGLNYEIDPPQAAAGVMESIERGDIDQSSFAFDIEAEKWDFSDPNIDKRTITKIEKLYDVSVVTYAAYEGTEASVRSKATELRNNEKERQRMKLKTRALKLRYREETKV